ncbi:hypothetical protein V6N13_082471 [Hibiscus sabdariffa]
MSSDKLNDGVMEVGNNGSGERYLPMVMRDDSLHWCYYTAVYASPTASIRKNLWGPLLSLDLGSDHPWLLAVMGFSRLFREFVFDYGLIEVSFKGPEFTWQRGDLHQRLDWCLFNAEWNRLFPENLVYHLDKLGLDHYQGALRDMAVQFYKDLFSSGDEPRTLYEKDIVWNLGNEDSIDFWHDPWLGNIGPLIAFVSDSVIADIIPYTVASVVDFDGEWKWHHFRDLLPAHVLLRIVAIKSPLRSTFVDRLGWNERESVLAMCNPLILQYCATCCVSSVASKFGGNDVRVEAHWCAPATGWLEIWGVLEGLNYAWHLGYRKLEVELESLSAVRILNGKVGAEAHSNLLSHIFKALRRD